MPPQSDELTHLHISTTTVTGVPKDQTQGKDYKWEIVWRNVAILIFIYSMGIYGGYVWLFKTKWATFFLAVIYATVASLGVTAGSHRLWSHRAYKANLPLRILLATAHSAAFQNSVYEWARDHRVHHKYTDTDADPHNATRGLFYSHVGWLMLKKSKEVIEKGKTVYLDDIIEDPVVKFQHRFRFRIFLILAYLIPTVIPWYFWGEDGWYSFATASFRYCLVINVIMTINSFAHYYGTRPYDKSLRATDGQPFSILAFGEGWHNYHHVFPWDYRAAEFGHNGLSTSLIWLMSKIGWATELKTASDDLIRKRMLRTGDGTVTPALTKGGFKENEEKGEMKQGAEFVWGWNDPDMDSSDKQDVIRWNRL